jgi:hypothetical protein
VLEGDRDVLVGVHVMQRQRAGIAIGRCRLQAIAANEKNDRG